MMNNMTRLVRAPLINTDTLSLVPVSTGFDVSIFFSFPATPIPYWPCFGCCSVSLKKVISLSKIPVFVLRLPLVVCF